MKRALITLLVPLLLAGCFVEDRTVVRASPRTVVTFSTFDSALTPYGTWMSIPGYGRVWQPGMAYVGADFYPYGTGGRWLYSDAGWMFDSDYPFGWAVFHYGRWFRDPFRGWCWLPGDQWAPAWVSWRVGGPYIGWAPLGPAGAPMFHEHQWTFVEAGAFMSRNAVFYSVPPSRFHQAVAVTQPVYGSVAGPPPSYVSRATGVPVAPVPVAQIRSAGRVPPPPSQGRAVPPPLSSERQRVPPPPSALGDRRERQPNEFPAPPAPPNAGGERPDRRFGGLPPPPGAQGDRGEPGMLPPPPGQARRERPAFGAPPSQDDRRQRMAPPPPGWDQPRPAPPPSRADDARPRMAPPPMNMDRPFNAPPPAAPQQRQRMSMPQQFNQSPQYYAPAPPPTPSPYSNRRSAPLPPPPPLRRR